MKLGTHLTVLVVGAAGSSGRLVVARAVARGHTVRALVRASARDATGAHNRSSEIRDWKRRGERLVRASGLPYTVVRPGWFDHHAADQLKLYFLQGDSRQAGKPSDGAFSRRRIAQVLVASLDRESAHGKTLELVAERGPAPSDLEPMFAAPIADAPSEANDFDAIDAMANMPIEQAPRRVRESLRDAMSPSAGQTPPTRPTHTQGARP